MGGRLKGITRAAGRPAVSMAMRWMTAGAARSGVVRSSNGLSRPTIAAALDWTLASMMLNPGMVITCSTAGSASTIFSICSTAARVRLSEAPSGSWTWAMKAPWSSVGRKPVGVTLNNQPVASPTPTINTSTRSENRTRRRTTDA